jgi:hypothetical protein
MLRCWLSSSDGCARRVVSGFTNSAIGLCSICLFAEKSIMERVHGA